MKPKTYRIKTAFLLPPVVVSLCLVLLTALAWAFSSYLTEKIILPILLVVALIYCFEQFFRRVAVGEEELQIVKLFRLRTVKWLDINNVSGLRLGHRSYLLLATNAGFFFFYDNIANFQELQTKIVSAVDKERVDPELLERIGHPGRFPWSLVFIWGAALLVFLVTLFRFVYVYR